MAKGRKMRSPEDIVQRWDQMRQDTPRHTGNVWRQLPTSQVASQVASQLAVVPNTACVTSHTLSSMLALIDQALAAKTSYHCPPRQHSYR